MAESSDNRTLSKNLPTSEEVSEAAYDAAKTVDLVSRYQLSAVELSHLLDNLAVKPVPW